MYKSVFCAGCLTRLNYIASESVCCECDDGFQFSERNCNLEECVMNYV